ncbi:MAG: outer membrane protein assembly factor BamE [Candidatus Nanoarchaeia archaeon]
MNKLLWLGIIVLMIGITAAIFTFKSLSPLNPADTATGAAINTPTGELSTTAKLSEIEVGMTKIQVQKLAGEPIEKQTITVKGDVIEYWYYECGSDVYQIVFSGGKVSAVRKY